MYGGWTGVNSAWMQDELCREDSAYFGLLFLCRVKVHLVTLALEMMLLHLSMERGDFVARAL